MGERRLACVVAVLPEKRPGLTPGLERAYAWMYCQPIQKLVFTEEPGHPQKSFLDIFSLQTLTTVWTTGGLEFGLFIRRFWYHSLEYNGLSNLAKPKTIQGSTGRAIRLINAVVFHMHE